MDSERELLHWRITRFLFILKKISTMRKAVFNGPVIYLIASMQRESVQVLLWGSVHGRLLVSSCNSGAKGEPTCS